MCVAGETFDEVVLIKVTREDFDVRKNFVVVYKVAFS